MLLQGWIFYQISKYPPLAAGINTKTYVQEAGQGCLIKIKVYIIHPCKRHTIDVNIEKYIYLNKIGYSFDHA